MTFHEFRRLGVCDNGISEYGDLLSNNDMGVVVGDGATIS